MLCVADSLNLKWKLAISRKKKKKAEEKISACNTGQRDTEHEQKESWVILSILTKSDLYRENF